MLEGSRDLAVGVISRVTLLRITHSKSTKVPVTLITKSHLPRTGESVGGFKPLSQSTKKPKPEPQKKLNKLNPNLLKKLNPNLKTTETLTESSQQNPETPQDPF